MARCRLASTIGVALLTDPRRLAEPKASEPTRRAAAGLSSEAGVALAGRQAETDAAVGLHAGSPGGDHRWAASPIVHVTDAGVNDAGAIGCTWVNGVNP